MDTLGMLNVFTIVVVGLIVYFFAVLWVIARKTGAENSWMAWVPLLNLVLMCRIARKPLYYVALLLIPLVNLVILILLWDGIAKARGKSPVLGWLMVIPLVNLVAGLVLAMGPANIAASPSAATATAQPAVCPACGSAECVGEEFCGFTGQRIVGMAAPQRVPVTAPAPATAGADQPGLLAKVILGVILTLGGSYFGMGLLSAARKLFSGGATAATAASAPGSVPGGAPAGSQVQSGAVPPRAAGTLTEFPVDTAATPARPTSVVSQNLRPGGTRTRPRLPPRSLPAGLPVEQLPAIAEAMTTATYQSAPTDAPVSVHVLNTTPGEGPVSQQLSQLVTQNAGPGAETSGIHVQSPSGAQYDGFRVRTPQDETYILDKVGAPIAIVIFAPDPSVKGVADRLAGNVGNGNGLLDDPAMSSSLATLPRQLPGGLELAESNSFTGASLEGSMEQLTGSLSNSFGPESRQWIDQVRRFIPPRLSTARYVDASSQEFNMVIGDYGGTAKAWSTWELLRVTLGLGGMQPVTVAGGTGIGAVESGRHSVLFRRGASLGFVTGPDDRVVRLAESGAQ